MIHNLNVNEVRRSVRDQTAINVEDCSRILVATADPTGLRQLNELDRAIARLPEDQRQVLLLVGLEGMSYEDVAAILNIPIGTVRSRLSRGRDLLRKIMGIEERSIVKRSKPSPLRAPAMAA